MATIDRNQLLADVKLWLPTGQPLSDTMILTLNEFVITSVLELHNDVAENESDYEPEIRCKCLLACANKALSDSLIGVSTQKKKREKVNRVEQEWYEGANSNTPDWKKYIKNLSNLCPLFGYTGLPRSIGMKIITTGTKITPCPCDGNSGY